MRDAGYDNALTMTAVFEDGAVRESARALRELQYMGEHSLLRRYIRDDVIQAMTLFKLNRPIELCGRWFPSPVITRMSGLRAQ